MYKKVAAILVMVGLILGLASACGPKVTVKKLGEIEIEILEPASLKDKALKQWYEDFYRSKFSHDVSHIDGYKYVLICAGEMPTGGYWIDIVKALKENGTLLFYARLMGPQEGEKVSQAITYPHVLFRVKETNEVSVRVELDMGGVEVQKPVSPDRYNGILGVYIGQADRNFVEIAVDKTIDFPGNEKPVVFKLTDEVNFSPNDLVKFDCVKNEQGQWEIIEIENLSRGKTTQNALGEYVGQIDANSVEIIMDGKSFAFRLADHVKLIADMSGIDEGTLVEIKFIEDGRTLEIIDLKAIPDPGVPLDADSQKAKASLIRQTAKNKVVLLVGEEEKSFWIAQELLNSWNDRKLQKDDNFEVIYYKDKYNRLVITSLE